MFGKKSTLVIEMLTGSLISGNRSGIVNHVAASPTSGHESKTQSPEGLKFFDVGRVGLGIVAALENPGGDRSETPASKALFSRNLSRSNPIPVTPPRNLEGSLEQMESESLEEYTIVTCHVPNKSYTKVYCDGTRSNDRGRSRMKSVGLKSNQATVFHISPARFGDQATGAPASDFLSSCHMCQKKLQDKDIYMYRGERAFCSSECRYRQIVMDERKEYCSSEATRPVDISSSPYANGKIFTMEILAI